MAASSPRNTTMPDTVVIFRRVGGQWQEMQQITPNDYTPGDQFGVSVALDGTTLVVGSQDDSNGSFVRNGSAYVYDYDSELDEWLQTQKLLPTTLDRSDTEFGASVDIDGDTIVIGAPEWSSGRGGISIWNRSGLTWSMDSEFNYSYTGLNRYGRNVVVENDHIAVMSGEYRDPVITYTYTNGVLSGPAEVAPSGSETNAFDLTIKGDWMVVGHDISGGDNRLSIFEYTGSWQLRRAVAVPVDRFRDLNSVAMTDDTNQIIVGAVTTNATNQGAAYRFERPALGGNAFSLVQTFPVSADSYNSGSNARFGQSVAAGDGEFFISAPNTAAITNGQAGAGNISFYEVGDGTPPDLTITSNASDPTNSAFEVTFTFTEPVVGFDEADIVVREGGVLVGGKVSGFSSDTSSIYRATITPTSDFFGPVNVSVEQGALTDVAGTANTAANYSVNYDGERPDAVLASSTSSPTNGSSANFNVSFGEAVTGFEASDISVTNGSVTTFTPINGGAQFDFVVEPSAEGVVSVQVPESVATDNATNLNQASGLVDVVFDRIGPVPVFSTSIDPTNANPFDVTISFNESFDSFNDSLLQISGASLEGSVVSGNNLIVTLTPLGEGPVSLAAQAGMVQDDLNNNSSAEGPFTVDYAVFGPTVAITAPSGPTNSSPLVFDVEFSEDVSGFSSSGVTATNGSVDSIIVIDGDSYQVAVNPSTIDGDVEVLIEYGAAQNVAAENNLPSEPASVRYDTVSPVATISSTNSDFTPSAPTSHIVRFTEDVTTPLASDFTTVNGAVSNVQLVSALEYTFDFTPNSEGFYEIKLNQNSSQDAAGNDNLASNNFRATYDATSPTVVLSTSARDPAVNSPLQFTAVFNEEVTANISNVDISVLNGSIDESPLLAMDGLSATFNVIPSAEDVTVSVQINAGATEDRAGNPSLQSNQISRFYNPEPITVTVVSESGSPTNDSPISYIIDFSAAPLSFTSSDVTPTNASIQSLSQITPTQYRAVTTPGATDRNVSVRVLANVVEDSLGNRNLASNVASNYYDSQQPNIALDISPGQLSNVDETRLEFVFDESVQGFDASDIIVDSGSISNFIAVNQTTYIATLTKTIDGTTEITVLSGAASDPAGNGSRATSATVTRDTAAPAGTINPGVFNTNQPPIGGGIDDPDANVVINIDGLTLGATNNGDGTWTSSGGSIENGIYSATATLTDLAGNEFITAAATIEINAINVVPTFSSIAPSTTATSPIPIDVNFDLDVVDFDPTDLNILGDGGAIVQNFTGSGSAYSFELVPSVDSEITVELPFNAVRTAAGDVNSPASITRVFDTSQPVVSFQGPDPSINAPFDLTLRISEEGTNGITLSDLIETNAGLSNFRVISDREFIVLVTPIAQGVVTIEVPDGTVTDGANSNSSVSYSVLFDSVAPGIPAVDMQTTFRRTPTITGTYDSSDYYRLEVRVDGKTYDSSSQAQESMFQINGGVWSLNLSSLVEPLVPDTYDVSVRQYDSAGNFSSDTTLDELFIEEYPGISGTVDLLLTSDSTPALSGTVSDPEASVRVTIDGQANSAVNNGDGSWSLADNTINQALADGTYDVTLAFQNGFSTGVDQTTDEVTIDSDAPNGTFSRILTDDNTPRLFGTVDNATASIEVTILGVAYNPTNNGDSTWELPDNAVAALSEGSYKAIFKVTSVAGNEAIFVVRKAITVTAEITNEPPSTQPDQPTSETLEPPEAIVVSNPSQSEGQNSDDSEQIIEPSDTGEAGTSTNRQELRDRPLSASVGATGDDSSPSYVRPLYLVVFLATLFVWVVFILYKHRHKDKVEDQHKRYSKQRY